LITIKENVLDRKTYLGLRNAVNWKVLSESQADKALKNSLITFTAFLDNKAVGMSRVVGDGAVICYVQDLVILPECQKLGVGKQLMERVVSYVEGIREENTEIMLCLMCSKGREKFYERFGFIARPTSDLGPGMILYLKK